MEVKKYGAVYTPHCLAKFVAELLKIESAKDDFRISTILDPACGEGALLAASKEVFGNKISFQGIDVDKEIKNSLDPSFKIQINDTIIPKRTKKTSADYWRKKLPQIDAVIANPPWSSEKIYTKKQLEKAGFSLIDGQYDSYVLFMELAYNLLVKGGYYAFIIPDSIFEKQNMLLRKLLSEKMQIRVIARLGEKFFENVSRATTVIVCKKELPTTSGQTRCFRLTTDDRRSVLAKEVELITLYNKNSHAVKQNRFLVNDDYKFDIDLHTEEEDLVTKIKQECIDWNAIFSFGRGVEISKSGNVIRCPICNSAQGYKQKQLSEGTKKCQDCKNEIRIDKDDIFTIIKEGKQTNSVPIIVGENVRRYISTHDRYVVLDEAGISYKPKEQYDSPKVLIRKTGLGIKATIDYNNDYTTQTVYILTYNNTNNKNPLEYYLALLNSRAVFYFYLKKYGENEWKSHPYLTKEILFTLPIKEYEESDIDKKIVTLCKSLMKKYSRSKDKKMERLVMEKYGLTAEEIGTVLKAINQMPDLSAINNMKMEAL
jgi:tRNA1(Val) A37 N6-methylase TrmN6